jgi:hypothetical protein
MGKLVVLVLGLALVSAIAFKAIGGSTAAAGGASAPKRTLDNVRAKATNIELEAQQRADRSAAPPPALRSPATTYSHAGRGPRPDAWCLPVRRSSGRSGVRCRKSRVT